MAEIDVAARLQLRAEQFTSETGRAFADMRNRAAGAAQGVRAEFVSSFAEVQRVAKQALALPRNATGSLDLSSEIAQLRQSAIANEERAQALTEYAAAASRAAGSSRVVTEAAKLEADAARVAASASTQDAGAIRQRILALEEIQRELNRTTSSTGLSERAIRANTAAGDRDVASSGQRRAAMQQLGFQMNDVATQFAAGTNASMIFAQQSGQVIQALQMMAGAGGGVLGFLASWQGAVVTAIAIAAIPFVARMFETKDALEEATKKMREQAAQQDINAQAAARWENSLDGVVKKIRDLNTELSQQLRTENQADDAKVEAARNLQRRVQKDLQDAYRERAAAEKELKNARQMLAVADPRSRFVYQENVDAAEARLKAAREKIAKAAFAIGGAEDAVRAARIPQLEHAVANSRDAATAATNRYTEAMGRLREERRRGIISEAEYQTQLAKEQGIRDAAIKKAQAANRSSTADRQLGRTIGVDDAVGIVEGIGGRVTSTIRSRAKQEQLYRDMLAGRHDGPVAKPGTSAHEFGNAVDVAYGPGISVASIRKAFAEEGVRLTKIISEPGQKVFHVEWAKNTEALRAFKEEARDAQEAGTDALRALDQSDRRLGITPDQLTGRYEAPRTFGGSDDGMTSDFEFRERMSRMAADEGRQRQEIAEERRRAEEPVIRYLADLYGDLFTGQTANIVANLKGMATGALSDIVAKQTLKLFNSLPPGLKDTLKGAGAAAGYGQLGGSVFSSITGGKNNSLASAAGGIMGEIAGKALAKPIAGAIGGALGKSLSTAAGPIGAALGGILGNVVSGLFSKPKTGSANITSGSGAATLSGTDGALKKQAGALASSVQQGLGRIVDMFGAEMGAFNVSIGTYKGTFRVNTSGGATNGKNKGFVDYGEDSAAAVQAAIADAIRDGAIQGISAAAQKILTSGTDLDRALQKALAIESIPKDLKAMLDPVGAALDALNTKWKTTVKALDEGGASAEQRAQAEQLYKLQLDQVKASTASASQALKDFLVSLKLGSNSPYSLREQAVTARSQLDPYLAAINGGQAVDQAKYQEAARAFLDIERQLYGSTQQYFDSMNLIQAATNKAIAAIDNAVPVSKPVESPFAKATAENTHVINEQLSQLNSTMADVRSLLSGLGIRSTGGDFIGAGRLFASQQAA